MQKIAKFFGLGFVALLPLFFHTSVYSGPEERRYRVEIIVLEKPSASSRYTSLTDDETPSLPLKEAVPYVPIDENKLVLKNIKTRLARRSVPLFHAAWIQTTGSRDRPTQVRLDRNRLQGIVKIYTGKQLLVNTDLSITNKDDTTKTSWQTTTPVILDEINHLSHRQYEMILMVTPEVTRRV